MTLRGKLLFAQAPLAVVLLVFGAFAVRTLDELGKSSQRILEANYRSVLAAQRMKDALERLDRAARSGAIAAPAARVFDDELRVQEDNITEPGERELTTQLRDEWQRYRAALEARDPAALEAAFERTSAAANRILELNQDAMVRKSDAAQGTARRSRSLLIGAAALAIALGLLVSAVLTARTLRPVSRLAMAVRRVGEGDLQARARIAGEDEIARLGREFDTMAAKLSEYRSSSLGELLLAQQASQAAIDSLPDPVLVLASDGSLLNVNQSAESTLQIAPGTDPLARAEPAVRAAIEMVRVHVTAGKGPYVPRGLEEAIQLRDRRLLPRASPLYSEQGAIVGATIVLQDVTRLVRFDELKNDLVATVAHEFRTPLTSLRMAIHILLDGTVGPVNAGQADMLYAAREDCERLQGIVDDLLDLSRIEAGKVEVAPAPISAKALVEGAVALRQASATEAGVKVLAEVGEPVLPVLADAERIGLVLDNLIANAIRHSPPGAEVRVRALPRERGVRFEVADDGPGIPPEYRERIFEKFFRIPGTKGEGVGLGLYLSREIVRAHGGELAVASAPGPGACFSFTLPLPAAARAA